MTEYLKCIGFDCIKDKIQLTKILQTIKTTPDKRTIIGKNDDDVFVEISKMFGDNFGLLARGSLDDTEEMSIDFFSPFCVAKKDISCDLSEVDIYDENYYITITEKKSGNELTFLLQNILEFYDKKISDLNLKFVNIVGLAIKGTIILPIFKTESFTENYDNESSAYKELTHKAKKGDEKSKKLLNIQEISTIEVMLNRLKDEDFLSVVEGLLIPKEKAMGKYCMIGEILEMSLHRNSVSNENVYHFILDITGINLEICINEKDLTGIPEKGMRFMGDCLFQGKITEFSDDSYNGIDGIDDIYDYDDYYDDYDFDDFDDFGGLS